MNKLGIIQGRLSPPIDNQIQSFPVNSWNEEFALCKKLGLSCIEWIFEYKTMNDNPFYSELGITEIRSLSKKYDVKVNSLLADYFMEKKLFGGNTSEVEKSIEMLYFIIDQCKRCEISIIEIPLVDQSAIRTELDKKQFIENIEKPLEYANKNKITISLETSLPPKEFRELILVFKPLEIKINYDMGNSASLGFDPVEEMELTAEFIANVHIKDRVLNDGTVPLGTGDTDFKKAFEGLKKANYTGDFILQAARQDIDKNKEKKDIIETIEEYIRFVEPYLEGFM